MTTETTDPIPRNYKEWRHCIEHWCGLELSPAFIEKRLQALRNPSDDHTRRLIECYGESHYRSLLGWFERADTESKNR
ncbi:MAG: hypothetical protein EA419_06785 [Wenzhouxiangella sp.]|nr:MAG: hypothetical protein EA419_06785 [Wenzhouxiangella sp.]